MILSIILVSLAFTWLLHETKYLTIRLPYGKVVKPVVDDYTAYYTGLLAKYDFEHTRYKARTMSQRDNYNKVYANELELEQAEYARKRAEIEAHTCHICNKSEPELNVETREIKAGNSVCHVRGCSDCLNKWQADIEKSQKPTSPAKFTAYQGKLPLFIEQHRSGSHKEWVETSKGHGYHRIVEEFSTSYKDCLCGKDWLKEHEHFEYPEPTMELIIDEKSFHVNGNYHKGLITDTIKPYTAKVKIGRKMVTIDKKGG